MSRLNKQHSLYKPNHKKIPKLFNKINEKIAYKLTTIKKGKKGNK